ncbi:MULTISPECIES: ATP-dependent helicase HrpB [unclassified Oleiphilus]|jgi:ATP-dependent helicase HrpB|nr:MULTISPECIES: ATP-dependent helicase HrpB [unclassified Oleiphilus]
MTQACHSGALSLLPISQFFPQVIAQLSEHKALVLQAEPGAGKSTALPLALLKDLALQGKKILLLEPRRVAVKAIAYYLAKQLGEKVGERIGYQIKNDRNVSQNTVLEVVTEGILTRRLQQDPELSDIGLVIFDEFHERSIHSDLSLMLCLEVQQALRDDLMLLVMSATIDTQMLSHYMNAAPIVECPGRTFPVATDYQAANSPNEYLDKQVLRAIRSALQDDAHGDILVFLPGQGEIKRCLASAQERYSDNDLLLLPLYGGLSLQKQEQALQKDEQGRRKIIFATNIAETSLTIEGIRCVIDSGLERQMRYDAGSGMSRLETKYISKASAEQRQGRAGRTQAGHCIRLWSESKQQSLSDFQSEEICISDLTQLGLELCLWGNNNYQSIPWLTAPPEAHYNAAMQVLKDLGLLDQQAQVTRLGKLAAKLPVSPRLASMLLSTDKPEDQRVACNLAALLSEQDIFLHNRDTDISRRLNALSDFGRDKAQSLKDYAFHRSRVEQAFSSTQSLQKQLAKLAASKADIEPTIYPADLGKLLLIAFPERLAKQRQAGDGKYLMANGKGAYLNEDDSLFDEPWLVIADCDAQKKEGRIYSAAAIDKASALEVLSEHINEEERFEINPKTQKITGSMQTRIGAITIDSQVISNIPNDAFTQCLAQLVKKQGLSVLNWTQQCDDWLARASWLGQHLENFPSLSKQSLIDDIETWLLPYLSSVSSMNALKKVNILELVKSCLDWNDQQRIESEAPTHYQTPSQKRVPIRYDSDQGPTVSVVLQEVFGELSSPTLAEGRVPLRFELLSPARRPIQTTSDLANFWNSSYFEVAKDMKGRYPKHRWPDKPLEEKAGRSIKRK